MCVCDNVRKSESAVLFIWDIGGQSVEKKFFGEKNERELERKYLLLLFFNFMLAKHVIQEKGENKHVRFVSILISKFLIFYNITRGEIKIAILWNKISYLFVWMNACYLKNNLKICKHFHIARVIFPIRVCKLLVSPRLKLFSSVVLISTNHWVIVKREYPLLYYVYIRLLPVILLNQG